MVVSSAWASWRIFTTWSDPSKLDGKSTVTESDQGDFCGFNGHPASEIDLILSWTFSPFVIGILTWFIFIASPSAIFSSLQTYVSVELSYFLALIGDGVICQSVNAPVIFWPVQGSAYV